MLKEMKEMKEMKKLFWVVILPLILFVSAFGADFPKSHVIKDVKYYPMLDGYCAMTALRMNLNYYDVNVEQSLLLNLGWNYGFFLLNSPFYITAYPCTEPVAEIVHVSNILGFEAKVLTHRSLEQAKKFP